MSHAQRSPAPFRVAGLRWPVRQQELTAPPRSLSQYSVFPDADRDNYGEPLGLWTARYNWFISDRTTITAGTLFDTFDNPETLYNIGIMSQRSARGSLRRQEASR